MSKLIICPDEPLIDWGIVSVSVIMQDLQIPSHCPAAPLVYEDTQHSFQKHQLLFQSLPLKPIDPLKPMYYAGLLLLSVASNPT